MSPSRIRIAAAWLILMAVTLAAAWLLLDRVGQRKLFLVALPFDRAPLAAELNDARHVAGDWTIPALAFLAILGCALAASVAAGPIATSQRLWGRLVAMWQAHPWHCVVFLVASLADLLSTAHYFHAHRIDDELHPGIKLVTYAIGLTTGCLIGKLIQAFLALSLCAAFPRFARPVLILLAIAYVAAAVWNVWLG